MTTSRARPRGGGRRWYWVALFLTTFGCIHWQFAELGFILGRRAEPRVSGVGLGTPVQPRPLSIAVGTKSPDAGMSTSASTTSIVTGSMAKGVGVGQDLLDVKPPPPPPPPPQPPPPPPPPPRPEDVEFIDWQQAHAAALEIAQRPQRAFPANKATAFVVRTVNATAAQQVRDCARGR